MKNFINFYFHSTQDIRNLLNDMILPLIGYGFIFAGVFNFKLDILLIGVSLVGLHCLFQISAWLAYLNKRVDKYANRFFEEVEIVEHEAIKKGAK